MKKNEELRTVKLRKGLLKAVSFLLALIFISALNSGQAAAAKKYTTVYKGVDYARVYNYSYYIKKYPSVVKKVGKNPSKVLQYFVNTGMKKQQAGCSTFDPKSYRYGNPSLRKKYRLHYKKYYLYYMKTGYKLKDAKSTRTGVKKMVKPATTYAGKDYSSEYDYFYYTAHNKDVVKAYKDDDIAVLQHYVKHGKKEGRKGRAAAPASKAKTLKGTFTITSCKISGSSVAVKAEAKGVSSGEKAYLFAVPSYIGKPDQYKPVASATVSGTSVTLKTKLNKGKSTSVLQDKFVIALSSGKGYEFRSNSYFIQNPEACASVHKAFPKPKRGTKKGLKTLISSDYFVDRAISLKCSHVVVDFPLETFLGGTGYSYTYEGKTYNFSSSIKTYQKYLKKLRSNGIAVTGIFYLSSRNLTKYMLPSAASGNKSKSATFAINTKNSNRKTLEALFTCLAENWTKDGALVGNWIFANESNQYVTYNYSGNVSYDSYIQSFTEGFRLFNTAIKSVYENARTYICFDHNWNLNFDVSGSYNAKRVLASFSSKLKTQGTVHFDIALHPYSSPEQDPRFWIRSTLVQDSADTGQYTMLNLRYITSYIKDTYGKGTHIILPETAMNSKYLGKDMQNQQAAALAYTYYLCEFNKDIDMVGIHREQDDPGETAGGFYLGLYTSRGKAKKAVNVFKYMDTGSRKKYVDGYLKYIGKNAKWEALVPGFSGSKFR